MKKNQVSGYYPADTSLGFQPHLEINFTPAAALTATATTDYYEVGSYSTLRLTCAVTAATGTTPTLDLTVQTSPDATNWYTAGTFAQKTTAATERKIFPVDRYVRIVQTVGGTTPSFTFTLKGFSV